MFKVSSQSLAFCAVLWTAGSAVLQVAAQQKSGESTESEASNDQSLRVREQMRSVQAWFDESNDDICYRLAFVAKVSEIRTLRTSDNLMGELEDGETDVVVLQVREIGRLNEVNLKASTVIVCPVGASQDLWKHWRAQKTEMVFEYCRIGKRAHVHKFGC